MSGRGVVSHHHVVDDVVSGLYELNFVLYEVSKAVLLEAYEVVVQELCDKWKVSVGRILYRCE